MQSAAALAEGGITFGGANSILSFMSDIHTLTSENELTSAFLAEAAAFGIRTAAFVRLATPGRPISPTFVFGQGDQSWGAAYVEHGAQRNDPAISAIFRSARPFLWSDLLVTDLSRKEREVFGLAADFGHLDGLVIPVIDRGAAVSTVIMTAGEPLRLCPRERSILAILGSSFARRGLELEVAPAIPPKLTPREAQCLSWVAEGKSDWAIASILSLAPPTVHMHIENARRKLGSQSRFQAVNEAWRLGWLSRPLCSRGSANSP